MAGLIFLYSCVGFITMYGVARVYGAKLRRNELENWDSAGVFFFALMCAILWPLFLTYFLAQRPDHQERKEIRRHRRAEDTKALEKSIQESERIILDHTKGEVDVQPK